MENTKEIECSVSGRVQMVMFRDFVQRKARSLGIVGTVENKDDGSVRVRAQGGEEELKELIEHLHTGPLLARVANVDVRWQTPSETFQGFKIIY